MNEIISDKPLVFLSSTMHNLKQLRIEIGKKLEGLGYGVRVAEWDFPATPGLTIGEVCLGHVEKCDILVLIIDGNYGSISLDGDWLVRSEFMHAKRQRKAVYIMVEQKAWDFYQLALKHPKNKPDDYGIHAEVFRFLKELQDGQQWIHPFPTVNDLIEKLKKEFSAHYAVLLRSNSNALLIRTAHLLEQMHNLYRQKNHVQALLFAEDVLRIDSDNPEALVTRAVCKIRLHGLTHIKSIREGIEDCNRVLANNPRDYRAKYNLANFKLLSPDHDPSDVENELAELYKKFPEYEFYFKEDNEFKQMLDLRKCWSRPKE
ncbi:MAG TPA: DUF4062 domain-containing protein [Pyrinomonadaceae bacterium]|nr:DUF4062 domain-containing protein [Pyrinomonadaceae bacterium]